MHFLEGDEKKESLKSAREREGDKRSRAVVSPHLQRNVIPTTIKIRIIITSRMISPLLKMRSSISAEHISFEKSRVLSCEKLFTGSGILWGIFIPHSVTCMRHVIGALSEYFPELSNGTKNF